MSVTNISLNLDLNKQQTIDIFLQPTITDEGLLNTFRIISNLHAGKMNIGLMEQLDKITRKAQHCNPQYPGKFSLSERTIEVKYAQGGLEWCYEELVNTHYDYLAPLYSTMGNKQIQRQLLDLIYTQLSIAARRDMERVAWFGDSNSIDADYNWADGIWTRMDEVILDGTIGNVVDTLSGTDITGAQAYNFLRDVVREAPAELRQIDANAKRIYISGNMWLKILDYLEDNAINNGMIQVFNEPDAGIAATYRGIPIMVQDRWDQIQAADFGQDDANYILYTPLNNLVLATDMTAGASASTYLRQYLEPRTRVLYVDYSYVIDTNFVFPQLISLGK
jgi:hypothetical protein